MAALGHDAGPMTNSYYVYVNSDVVVKTIDAGDHPRLDREIALDNPAAPEPMAAGNIGDLEELVGGRSWWRDAR